MCENKTTKTICASRKIFWYMSTEVMSYQGNVAYTHVLQQSCSITFFFIMNCVFYQEKVFILELPFQFVFFV